MVMRAVMRPWMMPTARPPSEMVRKETRPRTMFLASIVTSATFISLNVVIMLYRTTATPSSD